MFYLDIFVRFLGISLLFVLVVFTLRDLKRSRSARYLMLSCISTIGLLIGFSPISLPPPEYLFYVARLVDTPQMIFIWLFALSLFDSQFQPRLFHAVVALAYCLPILLLRLSQFGLIETVPSWIIPAINLGVVPIIGHLFWVTIKGRSDDLNEGRRSARYYFIAVLGFVAIASALTDLIMTGELRVHLPTAKAAIFLPSIIFACWWLLRIDPTSLSFGVSAPHINEKLTRKHSDIKLRLDEEMREKKAYLDSRLSIISLAKRIGTPPYRLRMLINKSLGHQNFSIYVNRFRVEAVKEAFADTADLNTPILTIALNNGFNSLSPFNRAFREIEGMTPSEYRRQLTTQK